MLNIKQSAFNFMPLLLYLDVDVDSELCSDFRLLGPLFFCTLCATYV